MSYLRTIVPAVLVVGLLAWALATGQQPDKNKDEPAKVTPKSLVDPGAQQALDDAVAALDRAKLPWIETTVWQRMEAEGIRFEAKGVYLAAPDDRLHLLLKVKAGDASGRLEIVCDGATYWETLKLGSGKSEVVRKFNFKKVQAVLAEPGLKPEARAAFLSGRFFGGVVPLLTGLKEYMVFSRIERQTWNGHDVDRLIGVWTPRIVKSIAPDPKQPWPAYLPNECRLYLDRRTHWPHRLEWWGPAPGRRRALLFEMEFRNPRFEPMTPERCAKVFKFAGEDKAPDQTEQVIKMLRGN